MPAHQKVSDQVIFDTFEETGSIRETARRSKLAYSTVHARLWRRNKIIVPAFNAPDGSILYLTYPRRMIT